MKILAISTWFPFPPDNGAKARAYNLLRYLGARHDLDLLAMSQSSRDAEYIGEVERFCRRVAVFPEPEFNPRKIGSLLGFFSATPRYFAAHHSSEIEALAERWAREESYDAAIAVSLGAAPYAVGLDVPLKVLDQHNVESQVIKRQSRNESSRLRRLRRIPTWVKTQRFERQMASKFDVIAVVSEIERDLMGSVLRNGHRPRIEVIPNGFDPELLEHQGPAREDGLLLFTGALTYKPNYDAVMILCKEILPAIRVRRPEARLRVTGRTDGVDISSLATIPGVEFTGYVEDIRPIVSSASALVAPLRLGGGTRLKILEAMALGTPVVSTSVGAEGLGLRDGVHILLGDTSALVADQTVTLLDDDRLAQRIAENAREFIRERYAWPAIAAKLDRALLDPVSAGAGEEF